MTYNMPGASVLLFEDRFMLAFKFFILQALGIHFEDMALVVFGRLRFSVKAYIGSCESFYRIVGYLWVISWFWLTLGWGGDAYLKSGIMGVNDVPIPIAEKTLRYLNL